jgi:hypothetical protein
LSFTDRRRPTSFSRFAIIVPFIERGRHALFTGADQIFGQPLIEPRPNEFADSRSGLDAKHRAHTADADTPGLGLEYGPDEALGVILAAMFLIGAALAIGGCAGCSACAAAVAVVFSPALTEMPSGKGL